MIAECASQCERPFDQHQGESREIGHTPGSIIADQRDFSMTEQEPLDGTVMFDGAQAIKGYALNKMCYSFNDAANREAFLADEEAYMSQFGLNDSQKQAIRDKVVLDFLAAGGNIYYLAKFAGIFGLGVQDVGAQQTGMSVAAFKAKLLSAGN